jgi:hypothetical protein
MGRVSVSARFQEPKLTKAGDTVDDLYKKMELLNGADENGRYWEIRPRTFLGILSAIEVLRETDMVELADWIARELGWIKRDRDVVRRETERASATISVGLGDLECAAGVAGGDGELKRGEDPGEIGRAGEPGEIGRGVGYGDPLIGRAIGMRAMSIPPRGEKEEISHGAPVEIERAGEPGEIERAGKWRSFYVPDDFHDMLIAEVELSSGSKDYFLCVIDDSGQMVDPESGDNLGWDYECISRWVPFDEFLTWANDDV